MTGGDYPPGMTARHLDSHLAERPVEWPCERCEAEAPPRSLLCDRCRLQELAVTEHTRTEGQTRD